MGSHRDVSRGAPSPVDQVGGELLKKGVFVIGHVNHFIVAPPLIITEEEMDFGVQALDEALTIADELADKNQ